MSRETPRAGAKEAGLLSVLFRWWAFFPIVILGAAALVVVSLGSALLPPPTGAAPGRVSEEGVVLAGNDLAHAQASDKTVIYVPRDAALRATGLRVAAVAGAGPVADGESGVAIGLAPSASQALGPGPLLVEVTIAPVPVTTAPSVAVGLARGEAMEWITVPTPGVQSVVAIVFPRAVLGAAPTAIGLRPIGTDDGNNFGLEIRQIRIRRVP